MGFFTGQLPKWATGASAAITPEPTEGKKDAGWAAVERPPHQYFNWWMRRVYERLLEVDGILARALTWTAKHTFGAGAATPVAPSTGDDVVNKTYADGLITALKAAANVWALQQKMSGGGDALQLKAGPAGTDAVFLSFFPRGATPNVRGAWMGYGANGSAELWVLNEIGQAIFGNALDADVKILRNGASVISFYGNGTTDAHNRRIINLADPSFPSDAATANYAQALIASLKEAANTWASRQTFNSGITVSDGHLDLTLAASQGVRKSGGLFQVGTIDDQEVQITRGGVLGMALHAGAEPYFASHKLTGVADPTNPGDAATKGYVDARGWLLAAKTDATQSESAGTLTNASGLSFPVDPGTYEFEAQLVCGTTTATTTGQMLAITSPATSAAYAEFSQWLSALTKGLSSSPIVSAFNGTAFGSTNQGQGPARRMNECRGFATFTASGTFQIQFKTGVPGSAVTLEPRSFVRYRKIG
jgi:hypothetical protein